MNRNWPLIGLITLIAISLIRTSLYILPEGLQGIVTEFGKPVGAPKTAAGLYFKAPWREIRMLDKRILNWDGIPNQIPTKDKKYIVVDTTARWQIADPLLFIRALQDERQALRRIDAIIEASTRDTISSRNLVEAVRNTNSILDEIKRKEQQRAEAEKTGALIDLLEEEITGDIELVGEGREKLSQKIVESARGELHKLGINLIDVQLRRIAYEESVEAKVYQRMISERQRIAHKIRSVGKGEQAKIGGKTSRDLQEIESEAYRQVQEIEGKAQAESIRIYAAAVGSNAGFYEFLRTIEAYRKGLREDTNFILSADAEFLRLFREGGNFRGKRPSE